MSDNPLRFEYIVYPLWRRKIPSWLRLFSDPLLSRFYPVKADRVPPQTPEAMAKHLTKWEIFGKNGVDWQTLTRDLLDSQAVMCKTSAEAIPRTASGSKVRIPAQWEAMEKVLISWGIQYPPVWTMHAQMAERISQVAEVEILVPTEMWAHAVWLYLSCRGKADLERIHFLVLPTNDIWIRDYGPIIGFDEQGQRVAVNAIYDPLPIYPQALDNGMPRRWAAHYDMAARPLKLHTEGGNLWSDGLGTLMMSSQIFYSNRYYDRDSLLCYLHSIFDFDKLIITPRLRLEETGHIDLLIKLASADTAFVSAPTSLTTASILRKAKKQLERETNSAGQPYQVVELPTPPLYLNWIFYTIRRAYTNSLTINGQVLVPTFGIPQDDKALKIYQDTMPDYTIVPIDCQLAINGGGAVHCMTKEVPRVIE